MDLLLSSPNQVATNLMGSDFVEVPELNGPAGKPEEPQGEADTPLQLLPLPPPPPLIPAPELTTMEEVKNDSDSPAPLPAAMDFVAETPVPPPPPPQESMEEELNRLIREANAYGCRRTGIPSISTSPNCPQIMTRKRSSMSAGSGIGSNFMSLATAEPSQVYMEGPVNQVPTTVAPSAAPPPKKKKKYTPKPKKAPTTVPSSFAEGSAPPPPPPPAKPNKPKSTKKKTSPVAGAVTVPGGAPIADLNVNGSTVGSAKSKKPSKPKASKKKPTGCDTISSSTKSKSSSKKKPNVMPQNSSFPQNQQPGSESMEGGRGLLVPPLKIHMPKLTKMVPSVVKSEPVEGEEWDEPLDPLVLAETELLDGSEGGTGGKGGRKKKSKGRNGNIYIGVFNRIEWMKLQNEFGFGSVNNFGTFVLQTMRRVHGDIQFWCDVAVGSGIYPDLDHYKWTNGFPHAVNKEAQLFTPEPDLTISENKRDEVIEMAKGMWDQRLQALKQQQNQLSGEGVEGEDTVIEEPDVVEVDDEEEDEEDDPLMMPGLENYLENMASGKYSPLANGGTGDGGSAQLSSLAGQGTSSKSVALSEEEVNKIWNEQVNDADNVEKFGKLFSFINSIAAIGKREDGEGEMVQEEEVVGGAVEGNQGDEGEVQEAIVGVGAN